MGFLEQALRAQFLFKRNKDYLVQAGKVVIVDEFTGRLMPGRRWSDGLHQAVEAKEGVRVEAENVTYATITIQNYFRMYEKLCRHDRYRPHRSRRVRQDLQAGRDRHPHQPGIPGHREKVLPSPCSKARMSRATSSVIMPCGTTPKRSRSSSSARISRMSFTAPRKSSSAPSPARSCATMPWDVRCWWAPPRSSFPTTSPSRMRAEPLRKLAQVALAAQSLAGEE